MVTKTPMKLTFTSFRGSMELKGLKVSLDRRPPRHCGQPVMLYLVVPTVRNLTNDNMERICTSVLDNNWNLLKTFISDMYGIGVRHIILCDWCTEKQIEYGKFCVASVIGEYVRDKADRDGTFEFPLEIEYGDGRGSK